MFTSPPLTASTAAVASILAVIGGMFAIHFDSSKSTEHKTESHGRQLNLSLKQESNSWPPKPMQAPLIPLAPLAQQKPDATSILIDKVLATDFSPGGELWQDAIQLIKGNEALARSLMDRYEKERDAELRQKIRLLLTSFSSEAVEAFAVKLTSANDPSYRKEAFEFLSSMNEDAISTRELILRTMVAEPDGRVIVQAIRALKHTDVGGDELAAITAQLRATTQSPYAEVRMGGLQALAQWDKSSDGQQILISSLQSTDPALKLGSLNALLETDFDIIKLKPNLFSIAVNRSEEQSARIVATHVLFKTPLEDAELELLSQIRIEYGIQ